MMATSLQQRCQGIELLVLDVDGVLTDGRIIYTDDGIEIKAFHVRDGAALALWRRQGKKTAIITGRTSKIVECRAAELGIDPVIQGVGDKLAAFRDVLAKTGMAAEKTCYVGDDLPDLPILCNCGLAVTVADACPEVIAACHYVTQTAGGRGAVREVVELLLGCQGSWQTIVDTYRAQTL